MTEAICVEKTTYRAGYRSGRHQNACAQLIYPSRGVMILTTDRGRWVAPQLRAVWLPANEPHSVDTRTGLEMHSVYCRGEILNRLPNECAFIAVNELLRILIIWSEGTTPSAGDKAARNMARALIAEFIAMAVGDAPSAHPALYAPPLKDKKLQALEHALMADPANGRSQKGWARELGMSERTLSRRLRNDAGVSFTALRTQIRLTAALELLAKGRSVTETAHAVGFHSASAFVKMFKQACGVTPGRYFAVQPGQLP